RAVVLFGGYRMGVGSYDDTWEWDGSTWTARSPSSRPSARGRHALAYDTARGRVVLFGGYDPALGNYNDTWEWDGANWIERFPAVRPPVRNSHALVYDAARGRVLLFGGKNFTDYDDTWEWDGTNWTQLIPTTRPPARSGHALAYDAARGRVVLFGGEQTCFGCGRLADTWEWDGTNWTQRRPAVSPSLRMGHALTYDAARSRVVLFGGRDVGPSGGASDDTWEWDGTNWTERFPATRPDARGWYGLTYDLARTRV
ncbi:MAG: peptidase S8, partial [Planctomycetes bacterium]|nr:peptidase S8 [Planctomycetota bacterium]